VSEAILEVRDLTKHFGNAGSLFRRRSAAGVRAVDGVSFTVDRGKTLGLVGESGSGKSTTGYCVLRLIEPTSGTIRFQGEDITAARGEPLRRLRRDMQVIFQDPLASLNPYMSVEEIVAEPLLVHGIGTAAERAASVRRLLDLVGLPAAAAGRRPHEFSGGQCQRIGIARALALEPQLIVCDEAVSALDISIQAQILNLLKDIQRDTGVSYLFIAHDLAVVRTISDSIAVMQKGKVVESGPAAQIYDSPAHAYTRQLLAAAPVPDPRAMRARRAAKREVADTRAEPVSPSIEESA
jgi:ABC-type oligopeptide transport system ATPase subunit